MVNSQSATREEARIGRPRAGLLYIVLRMLHLISQKYIVVVLNHQGSDMLACRLSSLAEHAMLARVLIPQLTVSDCPVLH